MPSARAPAAFAGDTAQQSLRQSLQQPLGRSHASNAERAVANPAAQRPAAHAPPQMQNKKSPSRAHLAAGDDIERAPSIGPKTAERFYKIGIRTVGDLLEADAMTIANMIDTSHIPAETIADWQDQIHLVMAVPGLRGGHAQLLVGSGYHTVASIAQADPATLSADLLKFASTADGQRILRDALPPDIERIKNWIDGAAAALAA